MPTTLDPQTGFYKEPQPYPEDSAVPPPPSFTPEEAWDVAHSDDFAALPPEKRSVYADHMLSTAFEAVNDGQWSQEKQQQWHEFASTIQQRALPNWTEKATKIGQQAYGGLVQMVAGLPGQALDAAMAGVDALNAVEDPKSGGLAKAYGQSMIGQGAQLMAIPYNQFAPRAEAFDAFQQQLEAGQLPLHDPEALKTWAAEWTKQFPDLGTAQGQEALQRYLRTRNPNALHELGSMAKRSDLSKWGVAQVEQAKDSPEVRDLPTYLQEQFAASSDPLNVALMAAPMLRAGKVAQASTTAARVGQVAKSAGEGAVIGAVMHQREDPNAGLSDTAEAAATMAAMTGGIASLGAIKKKPDATAEGGTGTSPPPPDSAPPPRPEPSNGGAVEMPRDGMEGAADADFAKLEAQLNQAANAAMDRHIQTLVDEVERMNASIKETMRQPDRPASTPSDTSQNPPTPGTLGPDQTTNRLPSVESASTPETPPAAPVQAPYQGVNVGEVGTRFDPTRNKRTWQPPAIPDNPLGRGSVDVLDFLNENPLKKAGTSKEGGFDRLRAEDVPRYWGKFIYGKNGIGYPPDELAMMAHREGLISDSTPDALASAVHDAIKARQTYRASIVKGKMLEREQINQHKRFEKAKTSGEQPVETATLEVGDKLVLNDHPLEVVRVDYDEDGYTTGVQVKDGPTYGVQHLSGEEVLLVDEFKPKPRKAPSADFLPEDPFSLESPTPSELRAESKAATDKQTMRDRAAAPLTGGTGDIFTPDMLDPTSGETPLFTFQAAREWADKTIKDKAGQLRTGIDPELVAAYAIKAVGAGVDFATYVAGVVKEFGEGAREMARDAWVRVNATMKNDPQAASEAKPLNDALGGAPQDYTAWKAEDMQTRASAISAAYSTPELVRTLASDQGLQRMGLDPALREFVNAEALRRALADVGSATNDVDRIRAQAVLRQARAIYDVSGTEAGQHLVSRALAAKDLRAQAPDLAMTEAIEKEQSKVIDPALPVDAAAGETGKAAEAAGAQATEAVATALSDEEFEARLQPVLKGLMPMRKPEIESAVRALTESGETWRDVAIREAEQAVEQQFTRNLLEPAEKGALRSLIDNMKSILKSKVPRTGVKAPLKSLAEGVARVFLDYQNERGLFETAWRSAREKLLDKVAEEQGNPELAAELNSVLPASPHLWFSPQSASELFTRALAKLQGLDKPRLADVVLNSDRVGAGVLKLLTQEALDAGMDTVNEPAVQRQMIEAWKDWVDQAKGRAMVAERLRIEATRGKLLEGGAPLRKLINDLREKITGGLSWRDVFSSAATSQRQWEMDTYASIRKHQALKGLSQAEAVKLTREASKVWQQARRRVWQSELEKAQVRAGVKPRAVEKVKAASERLLKLINLGALDAATFRDALAKEFGIKDLSAPEIKQVRELAAKYQAAPEGVARRRLGQQMIEKMQDVTRLSKAELLESYWTTAVLSGWRTMVDIGLAVANGIEDVGFGGIVTALRTGNADVALRGVANVIGNLPRALNEAWHIAVTGDKSIMRNYQQVIDDALSDGGRDFASAARQLREKGGLVGKPAGLFMEGMARVLTALDHITQSSTAAGAKWLAMAEHPELYRKALQVTERDRLLARERALNELTGGAEPKTNTERVQVKARVQEIIDEMVPTEIISEAMTIGEDAAMQGEPTGLGGAAVELVRKVVGAPDSWVKGLETGPKAKQLGTRELVFALKMASTFGRVLTGTKFVRVVGHQVNRSLSYVPGIGLARFKEASMNGVKADVLIAKQLVGLTAGLAVLNWFRSGGKDGDEKRGIEGNWKNLNAEQRSQLYAQGKQPNTIWYRDGQGRVVSFNFQQWGLSGLFAALGAMEDQRRYHGHNKTDATVLRNGLAGGLFAWQDKAQLQGLQTILGESPYASDNIGENFVKRLNKWASMTVGGLVPRVLKDIDLVTSPTLRDSSEWWAQWTGQVPMLRELSTGARVDIFGNDIKLDRGPFSRVWLRGNEGKPYQLLGLLNERDVWLPDPSAAQRVIKTRDGRRPLAREERDRYQRLTGAAYADYIERNGQNFVDFIERGGPPEKRNERVMKIRATISKQTKPLRDRAAQAAVR